MRTRRGGMRYCSFPGNGPIRITPGAGTRRFCSVRPPHKNFGRRQKRSVVQEVRRSPAAVLARWSWSAWSAQALDRGTFLTTVRGRRFVGARLRHVIIEVNHPSLVEDLLEFLGSSSCKATRCGGQTVDVRAGWPLSEGGQRHLDLYLAAWEAKNPGARAMRVIQEAMEGNADAGGSV